MHGCNPPGGVFLAIMKKLKLLPLVAILIVHVAAAESIEHVWLTHKTNDPSHIVVNWETATPGDSIVHFGNSDTLNEKASAAESVTLHHVEIPFGDGDTPLHYAVETAGQRSQAAAVKRYSGTQFRAAVVADWQGKPDLSALLRDDPHVLFTAGDNINCLHTLCGDGVKDCVKPYSEMIAKYSAMFRTIPIMPALGNHDREMRSRGPKPPPEPVYDIDATAFQKFFPLPDDGWKWHFDIPAFNARFIALDLEHTSDFGTTWQTGHAFDAASEQFKWYQTWIAKRDRALVVTLHNERNSPMRAKEKGEWHKLFRQGTTTISGFGYFGERAEVDGHSYFNTALGTGAKYADPQSKFFTPEATYILLTFNRDAKKVIVEIKSLSGTVLDRSEQATHE